jgi:AhpD family alkylhydroperoxidase
LFARGARRPSLGHIRRVAAVPPSAASGTVAAVYRQMETEFGMLAPPVALHAPAVGVLAAVWSMLRETLLVGDVAWRASKEAVAAAVSLANRCPYCVEVHGSALVGLLDGADARLIAAGRIDEVGNAWLRDVARWAADSAAPTVSGRAPAPFSYAQAAEFIGVAVTFHYINRMVNIFLSDSPLAPVPPRGRRLARAAAVRVFGHFARTPLRPGLAQDLLPRAELPADLSWAAGRPYIAEAFARGARAIDEAGEAAVPAAVRELVTARLADPQWDAPGIDAAGFDRAVSGLAPVDRPAGRLALLAARASYRVTDAVVDEFRGGGRGDEAVIGLTSWASLAAARHIGQTLYRDLGTLIR